MKFLNLIPVVTLLLLITNLSQAQNNTHFKSAVVSGTGNSSIEKSPNIMRTHIQLMVRAETVKKALSLLNDRTEAAKLKLTELGAIKESIVVGPPEISEKQNRKQQQMEMMIKQMMTQRSKGKKEVKPTSVPITLTATIKAEWKLNTTTPEELLLTIYPLQKKIIDAKLSGAEETFKLSEEQQELLEEMDGMEDIEDMYGYSSGESAKPGVPQFRFVIVITDKEKDEATAKAFQKAKTKATRLAKATNRVLGRLVSISSNEVGDVSSDDSEMLMYRQYYQQQLGNTFKSAENEAISKTPNKISYQIIVNGSFKIEEK